MQLTGDHGTPPVITVPNRPSSDPRAEHTRQAVFAAICQLITDRAAPVTVSGIIRAAGISRSTFYAHFGSLDELAVEVIRRQFDDIADRSVADVDAMRGRVGAMAGYDRLVTHIVDNFPLYWSALQAPHTRAEYHELVESYSSRLIHSVITPDDVPDDVDVKLVATYIAGGAMTLISAWMRGEIELSDDDLVRQLVDLLPPWILESPTKETAHP